MQTLMQQKEQKSQKLLNQPYKLGDLELKNRFVMAPLTRCRANPETSIPNDLMKEYYTQRSTFGLIITECAQISDISYAFPGSGGIFSREQAKGWKKIVDSVHEKGAKIIMQIWHAGRAVALENNRGQIPISSSAVVLNENHYSTNKPHPVPREMTQEDIKLVIEQFRQGAQFAKEAGFDGIQLHAANGYLVDQFLRDGVNKRTDQYGGSIENRSRFLFQVIDVLASIFGYNRTSVRLSPTGRFGDMYDSNPLELIKYILKELEKKNLHFVEVKRHGYTENLACDASDKTLDKKGRKLPEYQIGNFYKTIRPFYKGILMGNDGFNPDSAEEAIKRGELDLVSFGRLAINNYDLPQRYENQQKYNSNYDVKTFYSSGEKGYTDFLPYQEWIKTIQA